jgi:hypothetical protein
MQIPLLQGAGRVAPPGLLAPLVLSKYADPPSLKEPVGIASPGLFAHHSDFRNILETDRLTKTEVDRDHFRDFPVGDMPMKSHC